MTDYELIKKALAIAKEAHRGQKDKAGEDYIFHPVTVALLCGSAREKAAALLHDVLEDAPDKADYGMLVDQVGKEIADAVQLLTYDCSICTYQEYISSIKESGNALAIAVKKADLTVNMDLSRIKDPSPQDIRRINEKYQPAMELLSAVK